MTEQTLLPSTDEPPEAVALEPQKKSRTDPLPLLYGLGFLILAAAIFYLWQYPSIPSEASAEANAIQSVQQHLADIDARLTKLEQRPTPDIGKITARLDALDGRVADQTQLASRLDTLSGRIESLSGRDQTGLDATRKELDGLNSRVAAVQATAGSLDAVSKRLNRIARLQEASFALASGRPLGELPDAPEALVRFANAAPPTEAQLRLAFAPAEQAALAVKQPDDDQAPFVDRVWERAQGLVTIRRGGDVMIGNPSAMTLSHAQAALDAGDLAGAVQAVDTLKGQPGQAMADWLAEAKALLSARSALSEMADKA